MQTPSLGSNLTSGGGDFNIMEQLKDTILKMLKEAIEKNADHITHGIIKEKLEENMESLFKSYTVQLEASKMFNRELFPIYKRALEEFAKFNTLVKEAKEEIGKAIEEYTTAVIANPNDTTKKTAAKDNLMKALMTVSETKVGDVLSMKGGDLQSFLENKENEFKMIEGGNPAPEYVKVGTNKIDKALEQIARGMKEDYDKYNEGIKELNNADNKVNEEMRKKYEKKQEPTDLGNKQNGGKSKRRKHRKRNKTYKKRR